jgi:cell division protein FtsX
MISQMNDRQRSQVRKKEELAGLQSQYNFNKMQKSKKEKEPVPDGFILRLQDRSRRLLQD